MPKQMKIANTGEHCVQNMDNIELAYAKLTGWKIAFAIRSIILLSSSLEKNVFVCIQMWSMAEKCSELHFTGTMETLALVEGVHFTVLLPIFAYGKIEFAHKLT